MAIIGSLPFLVQMSRLADGRRDGMHQKPAAFVAG